MFPSQPPPPPPRRRGLRVALWLVGGLIAVFAIGYAGLLGWAGVGQHTAEKPPVAAVRADPRIQLDDEDAAIVLTPADGVVGAGLVFMPGAKVDPWAYAAKLSGVVADERVTVVITKPWLNIALLDAQPLTTYTQLAPDVRSWIVGGHSLGGVRACALAKDADALLLVAAYCGDDISGSGVRVLSIAGSEDGLSPPEEVTDHAYRLPADASFVVIDGATHTSFADYGRQTGDGIQMISDAGMTERLAVLIGDFAASLDD